MDERVELELDLAADGQEGYRVTVRSAAGEVSGRLLLDPESLLERRSRLQAHVLASAVTSRGAVSEVEAPVRELGSTLFRALFDDSVYAAYRASLVLAAERGTQLRVVLRTQAAELAALPWEIMYDPDVGAYLCQREPLVRHVSVPRVTHPLAVTPPLRILGLVAAPRDLARLDVEGERQRLQTALAPLGSRVLLHWVDGGTWADVQRELVAGEWHVLHFVGHGDFDRYQQEGVLALENAQGTSDLVGAERFSDLLTLQDRPLRLVLLNSCAGGQAGADDVFSSTAATLIRTGVSAVVAMQFAVSDPAAKAFAAGFYQAIAHSRTVAEAVRVGRIGIRGLGEETLEWVTPVLYVRGEDAALFEVLPDETVPDGPSPEDAAREAASLALYENALEQLEAREYAEAISLLDRLLADRDDYRDAVDRRDEARRELGVAEAYDAARGAEERGDWGDAARGYQAVLELDPDREGVRERLDRCRRRQRVASLQEELRGHVTAEHWSAAVAVADELWQMSPPDSDPDGLASQARDRQQAERDWQAQLQQQLRDEEEAERQRLADQKRREEEERRRRRRRFLTRVVAPVTAVLLVGGGIAVFWANGSAPDPFRSDALYELARHHFEPAECHEPDVETEAPVARSLPYTELLKCTGPDGAYTGTLFCAGSEQDYEMSRQRFLDMAQDKPQDVTEAPAGRSEPWAFQQAYPTQKPAGNGRVLWDDESSWCFAEMQVDDTDLGVAVDHFLTGLGS